MIFKFDNKRNCEKEDYGNALLPLPKTKKCDCDKCEKDEKNIIKIDSDSLESKSWFYTKNENINFVTEEVQENKTNTNEKIIYSDYYAFIKKLETLDGIKISKEMKWNSKKKKFECLSNISNIFDERTVFVSSPVKSFYEGVIYDETFELASKKLYEYADSLCQTIALAGGRPLSIPMTLTQVLDERKPEHREISLKVCKDLLPSCYAVAFHIDDVTHSEGIKCEIQFAIENDMPIYAIVGIPENRSIIKLDDEAQKLILGHIISNKYFKKTNTTKVIPERGLTVDVITFKDTVMKNGFTLKDVTFTAFTDFSGLKIYGDFVVENVKFLNGFKCDGMEVFDKDGNPKPNPLIKLLEFGC